MNPFGATLVLLLTARDAKQLAAESKWRRTISEDCDANPVPPHRPSSIAIRAAKSFARNLRGYHG
jgi:hypothetical protein